MKEKQYKYVDDLIEDYLQLSDEHIEIPLMIQKLREKSDKIIAEKPSDIIKESLSEDLFKIFNQIRKHQLREIEVNVMLAEAESSLKEFLEFVNGGKISYERRDDNDKSRITYQFWVEEGQIKRNR